MKPTGEELRDKGMASALRSANNSCVDWCMLAVKAITKYATAKRGPFRAEEVWGCSDLPTPPHHNAKGAAIKMAQRMKIIEVVGYEKSQHSAAHCRVTALWQAT